MSARLAGHELLHEGSPYRTDGRPNSINFLHSVGGIGCGKCSCGALSLTLSSGAKRKQWHRDHKETTRQDAQA